jgi:hypothetical protein
MSYEPETYGPEPSAAADKTSVPGILLLITGVVNALGSLWYVVSGLNALLNPEAVRQGMNPEQVRQMEQAGMPPQTIVNAVIGVFLGLGGFGLLMAILTILAGVRMRSLRGYGLAVLCSIVALLPCISPSGCCLLGQVAGIWALVVLMNADVKAAFR